VKKPKVALSVPSGAVVTETSLARVTGSMPGSTGSIPELEPKITGTDLAPLLGKPPNCEISKRARVVHVYIHGVMLILGRRLVAIILSKFSQNHIGRHVVPRKLLRDSALFLVW
jgi:hypothetical protein